MVDVLQGTSTPIPLPPAPPAPGRGAGPRPVPADMTPGAMAAAAAFGEDGPAGAGIHALALSPSGGALATGGSDAADVQIMKVRRGRGCGAGRGPGLSLSQGPTLAGHADWVFGLAWLTPRHLVSASRDRSLALWALPEGHDDDDDGGGGDGEEEAEEEEAGEEGQENTRPVSSPPTTPRRLVRAGSGWGGGGGAPLAAAAATTGAPSTTACAGRAAPTPTLPPACVASRSEKRDRVRDVRWEPASGTLASLTGGGVVRTWDACLNPLTAVRLAHDREAVCLAVAPGLVAAGTQGHVSLIDPRIAGSGGASAVPSPSSRAGPALAFGGTRLGNAAGLSPSAGPEEDLTGHPPSPAGAPGAGVVADLASPDGPVGVRSLALAGHLLSAGTGAGRLVFFDLRAGKWACLGHPQPKPPSRARPAPPPSTSPLHSGLALALTPPALPAPPPRPRTALAAGPGWLDQANPVYLDHFSGPGAPPVPPAIYAHAWAPSGPGGGLFAVGGPLATGLRGSYMGFWQ